ncbi:MAG: TetR/AcrR family transcriptional regulator [Kangiellaceae bacterium]|nr:TetR/AcrR family transcriptional regulator [Kangiellaceae bacterium]
MVQNTDKQLTPRRKPKQDRSVKRTQQIMDVTTRLLDRVGFDDLTTILITKELGISVGSLYHYFPNKHAILYTIAENWLKEWDKILVELAALPIEEMGLDTIVKTINKTFLKIYQEQRGILPLIHAIYAVPELRELDRKHDETVTLRLSRLFSRMGLNRKKQELKRIAYCYLEIAHATLTIILEQNNKQATRTLSDLDALSYCLLERYK